MKFVPSSPLAIVLLLAALFVVGFVAAKLFKKKKGPKEKFDDSYYGLPSTVKEFADSPKVLPPVPENRGVTTHDEWCQKFNC
ncbi:hypothetical protein ATCVMN08101_620L [Acanthocystis turfacea Chlorella virus MN0810.1]|nr:hypothetical protein ATCVMN08101_620L [Acanthocystis turfacea Chlorella virus MN0810.1]